MFTSTKNLFQDDSSSPNFIQTSWPTSISTTESRPKELTTIDASSVQTSNVQTSSSIPEATSAPSSG
jgi:hypothetical protein